MHNTFLSILAVSTALGTGILAAQTVTESNGNQGFTIDTGIPGGLNVNIQPDGAIAGTIEERFSVNGFPDEVDFSAFDAQINPDGSITGSFTGTDTFNVNDGNGNISQQTENRAGGISGTIDQNGNYTVSWTGPDPGTVSGTLSGFSLPGSEQAPSGNFGSESIGSPGLTREDDSRESAAEEVAKLIFGDIPVRSAAIVLKKIADTENFCRLLDSPYRIDCMADRYAFLARTLPRENGGGEAAKAFKDASVKLKAIVADSLDENAEKIMPRVRTNGLNVGAGRKLKAVRSDALASANRRAEAVIEELSTTLLRSSENSDKRKRYYTLMAEAVDSNKVLLRS